MSHQAEQQEPLFPELPPAKRIGERVAFKMIRLSSEGIIKRGDAISLTHYNNADTEHHIVKDVIDGGTDREEVVLNAESNIYFITSMVLDGTSWANDVRYLGLIDE